MTALLSVSHVSKRHPAGDGSVRALDDVSLEVNRGELVAIMGPSGCGKSTLLMIAGLLEPPTQGEVRFDGRLVSEPAADLDSLRDFRRREIGFVFQKPNLIHFLTAAENVALAMAINDVPPKEAYPEAWALLASLGLEHRVDHAPHRLSGGEQQRVAIARALANDPALILADEPTAALDGARGAEVIDLFRRIADERSTAIAVVTHDPRRLDAFDRVIRLEDGRVVGGERAAPCQ